MVTESDLSIQIGDTLRLKKRYKEYKGTVGTIIKISKKFITLRTVEGKELIRAPHNLDIIAILKK